MLPKVHVIHENSDWIGPFADAFEDQGIPWEEWFLDDGVLDLDSLPPKGVFYSRMSASAHSRGHTNSKDYTRAVLSWLESHGRTVVNGRRVVEMEMSKIDQHTALRAAGFDVPRTVAVVGGEDLLVEAKGFDLPFITKHNQGGKGLGVRRFDSYEDFSRYIDGEAFELPVDGITLIQEYVEPKAGFVTRVELVGGEFLYALTADTRLGFELCPADECDVPDGGLFHWREGYDDPIVHRYLEFARRWDIGIAGFENIETADGRTVTYDVNTNTNYNPVVDAESGRSGPTAVAHYLGSLL
jgi:hypothetical protein